MIESGWGQFTYPDQMGHFLWKVLFLLNTLLYSNHSLIRYHDCSIREYQSILAIITGHYIVPFETVHFNIRQVPDKNPGQYIRIS